MSRNDTTTDKCRACLAYSKTLLSIYTSEKDTTFAAMMNSLTKLKVTNDSFDKICRKCRKRLSEAYNFKCLLDRSNDLLNEMLNVKKITFSNLYDIKIKIEIDAEEECHSNKISEEIKEYFKDGVNEISYSDTVIKKVEPINEKFDESKPVPVLEFLKSLNQDTEDSFGIYDMDNFVYDSDGDDEYQPLDEPLATRKSKNIFSKKKPDVEKPVKFKKFRAESLKLKKVCIQPVYLKDVKLVKSVQKKMKDPTQKKVYHYAAREEMCPHCGRMSKNLKSHILIHTGNRSYKCSQCNKAYFSQSHLQKHMLKHAGKKDFKCEHCVAAFVDKNGLKHHMLMHTGERKYACSTCGKRFLRKPTLYRHERTHNFANKNVLCDLCNMSFFSQQALRHHMRVHTGERPFKCEICSQPYSYKHDFNRHCFKKHGVFLKRRSVYVMNEEVLKQEKIFMRDILLRANGLIKDGQPINPFEGPQSALAFEQALKALESKQIAVDFQI